MTHQTGPVYLQQSIVLAFLLGSERDPMQVLLFLWEPQVDELHLLVAPKTQVLHDDPEQTLSSLLTLSEGSSDLRVEDLNLLDAASDVKKLDHRMQVLD